MISAQILEFVKAVSVYIYLQNKKSLILPLLAVTYIMCKIKIGFFLPVIISSIILFIVISFSPVGYLGLLRAPLNTHLTLLPWILTVLLFTVILLISLIGNLYKGSPKEISAISLAGLITVAVISIIVRASLVRFYIRFELSLIPIFWLILGWGAQPERLSAGMSLLLYTALASLPFLIILIFLNFERSQTLARLRISNTPIPLSRKSVSLKLTSVALVGAFLVKFPLFIVHLWLPKAHVEAPVIGSIILAALLLKLGGYGIYVIAPLIPTLTHMRWSLQAFSLVGGMISAILCIRQKDIKVIIAYSSVCHIGIVICAILTASEWALKGAILIILAHGIASSALFGIAFFPYHLTHSRNMGIIASSLYFSPLFVGIWFLACTANMGGPLTLNLISEIILFIAIFNFQHIRRITLVLTAFFAVAYNLILYVILAHGQPSAKPLLITPTAGIPILFRLTHILRIPLLGWALTLLL